MPFELAIGWAVSIGVILVAFWRGSIPEKIVGAGIAGWHLADPIYHWLFTQPQFRHFDAGHFVLDSILFGIVGGVALRANRLWPIFASAAQMIVITGHFSMLLGMDGMQRAYYAMTQLPFYVQLLALLAGTVAHNRRMKRIGRYRDWRST